MAAARERNPAADDAGRDAGFDAGTTDATVTAGRQRPAPGAAPHALVGGMLRVERDARLDRGAARLERLAGPLVRTPPLAAALRGAWLGHALHPLLTDFPLGSWMACSFLDLFGGPEAGGAAQRLAGVGVLTAVPTVAAGLVEWQATEGGARRVGVVHAVVNSTATALYTCSWIARRIRARRAGVALGVAGGVTAVFGGYVGGHLSLVRKIGTADAGFGSVRNGAATAASS